MTEFQNCGLWIIIQTYLSESRLDGDKRSSCDSAGGSALDLLINILQMRWLLGAILTNLQPITSAATTSCPMEVRALILAALFRTNGRLAFTFMLANVITSARLVSARSYHRPNDSSSGRSCWTRRSTKLLLEEKVEEKME